jgi:predicted permease
MAQLDLDKLFQLIGVLAAMAVIGAALARRIPFGDDVKRTLVTIIVYVSMPCMIVNGLFQLPVDGSLLRQMAVVLLLSVCVHSLGMTLGWLGSLPLRLTPMKRKELAVLAGLGNTGFIGIPLCTALFGAKGALLAAVFDTGMDIVIWTYVVFMLSGSPAKRAVSLKERAAIVLDGLRTVCNAPMLAVAAGLLLSGLQVKPPAMAMQLLGMLGAVTVPLAMLYTGLLLAQLFRQKPKLRPGLLPMPAVVKLVALPAAVAGLVHALSVDADIAQVVITQSAMPTLTIASVIFAKCSADEELAAIVTAVTTVLSVAVIPIMIRLLI